MHNNWNVCIIFFPYCCCIPRSHIPSVLAGHHSQLCSWCWAQPAPLPLEEYCLGASPRKQIEYFCWVGGTGKVERKAEGRLTCFFVVILLLRAFLSTRAGLRKKVRKKLIRRRAVVFVFNPLKPDLRISGGGPLLWGLKGLLVFQCLWNTSVSIDRKLNCCLCCDGNSPPDTALGPGLNGSVGTLLAGVPCSAGCAQVLEQLLWLLGLPLSCLSASSLCNYALCNQQELISTVRCNSLLGVCYCSYTKSRAVY